MLTNTEMTFKKNLKKLRMSQDGCKTKMDISKDLEISYSYYHSLENPETHKNPSFEILEKIASIYNIQVYELFID